MTGSQKPPATSMPGTGTVTTPTASASASTGATESQLAADVCPRCSESVDLALIKGCLRCMRCGFKWDCNGW